MYLIPMEMPAHISKVVEPSGTRLAFGLWCGMLELVQGPAMVESRFPTAFPLKHQRKDLQLALRLAEEHCQTLPTAAAATDLFVKASSSLGSLV